MARRSCGELLFLSVAVLLGCLRVPAHADTPLSPPIVISHVTVVPMDSERLLEDRTVVVRDGRVWKIVSGEFAAPQGSVLVDGRGKYLLPGLADLHVHLFSSDDLVAYPLYGVTTVLNMDGSPSHLAWRQRVRAGKLLGPTLYTAGHTIDGYPPLNEMFLTAETPGQGIGIVREQKRAGYDVVKLYGTLRPDVFAAILAAAQQEKIPVVGHINRQVGALGVLQSSQVLAAHLEDLLAARFDHMPSDAELEEFATAIAASHITVTPNLNVNPTNIAQLRDLDGVLRSEPAKLLSPSAYSQWLPANNRNERNERNDQTAQQMQSMNEMQQALYKMVRFLGKRNVPLVLGTDAAPYGLPGFSVHEELRELVEAGFTPYQALLTATRNAGTFISQNLPGAPTFGTVSEGASGDLLLLTANPLTDIHHTEDIAGLVLHGKWMSATDLAELRKSTQARFANTKRETDQIDAALEKHDWNSANELATKCSTSSCIAEWVLMSKARKLQGKDIAGAINVARLNTQLYPNSFSTHYVLADLLFQAGKWDDASREAEASLAREPQDAAAVNLQRRAAAIHEPLQFQPAGSYQIEIVNDLSHDVQKTQLFIAKDPSGKWSGRKLDDQKGNENSGDGSTTVASDLQSVTVGGDRLWAVIATPFGSMELRLVVRGSDVSGYWAGPFGQNGNVRGTKQEPPK